MGKIADFLTESPESVREASELRIVVARQVGQSLPCSFKFHTEYRQRLADVVVQLPRDTSAFCLSGVDQTVGQLHSRLFGLPTLGDVFCNDQCTRLAIELYGLDR